MPALLWEGNGVTVFSEPQGKALLRMRTHRAISRCLRPAPGSPHAPAAVRVIRASGTFDGVSGSLGFLAGDSFTFEYVADTDPAVASVEQHDDPLPHPNLDGFDAWGFDGSAYAVTLTSPEMAGGSLMLGQVTISRYDNDSPASNAEFLAVWIGPPNPSVDPDTLDFQGYEGGNTYCSDPMSPLLGDPSDGVEGPLNAIMLGGWFEMNPPSTLDIPPGGEVYTNFLSATAVAAWSRG